MISIRLFPWFRTTTSHLPIFSIYSWSNRIENRCVICQMTYRRGDQQIKLPCSHVYHGECITKWLSINKVSKCLLLKFTLNPIYNNLLSPIRHPICLILFRNVLFATLRFLVRNQRTSISMTKRSFLALLIFCSSSSSLSPPPPPLFLQVLISYT